MRFVLSIILIFCAFSTRALELEGTFQVGNGQSQITVLGTNDFERVKPVFSRFSEINPRYNVVYLQASSREIDRATKEGLHPKIDLVMSSAIDLQIKAVNDGFATRIDLNGLLATHWREELVQISVEPIVSIYNEKTNPEFNKIKTRRELIRSVEQSSANLRIMMYDPKVSGVGYLLSRQDELQDNAFWSLIRRFQTKEFKPSCCSGEMIDAVVSGEAAIAYNVIESYILPKLNESPHLKILRFEDYQLAIPRTAFVPKSSDNPDLGSQLVRYFITSDAQARLPELVRLSVLNKQTRGGGPTKPIRLSPALTVHLDPMAKGSFFDRWDQ